MNTPKQARRKGSSKLISAITLAVLLALSIVFGVLGVTGRKLDSQGLYKLLPWLPSPSERYEWTASLVPGADLGKTSVLALQMEEGAAPTVEEKAKAMEILSKRMADMQMTSSLLKEQDQGSFELITPMGKYEEQQLRSLVSVGRFSFATPDGEDFLDGSHITRASLAPADQSMENWFVSFEFDEEGKKIFGEKTAELIGQSVTLKRDGKALVSAGINEALDQGGASIPGFTYEQAFLNAMLMRSGALPFQLQAEEAREGAPLLGEQAQRSLVIALYIAAALIALYLLIRFRLAGFVAAWTLGLSLGFGWFFAALIGAGFTLSTVVAVMGAFALAAYSLLSIYHGMADDLRRGRSPRQAIRESFATHGHTSLDILVAALLLCVILIIANDGLIGSFMRVFGLCLLVDLIAVHLVLRVLISNAISLFGQHTALFIAKGKKKEAV